MDPIVHGMKQKYESCIAVERVNYHARTEWYELVLPVGPPEFALLNSSKQLLYRWFGVVTADEFSSILDPLCDV